MARRKKRMKLPNGFGSIKYLGSNRRNPYAVYPPVTEWTATGPVTPPALGYKPTWEEAYELLTVYNMQKQGKIKTNTGVFIDRTPTFAEIYEEFYREKFERDKSKKYSDSARKSTRAAFGNCSALHDKKIGELKYDDLQKVIDDCPLKHASLELMVSLMHQMYRYAIKHEIVEKDVSMYVYIPKADDDESGEPFTDAELKLLWENKEDPVVQMLLIMCYSGYRITAYETIKINLEDGYFKGGVKTRAGKERIVPIHSGIKNLVSARKLDNILGCSAKDFRNTMYSKLGELGIANTASGKKHTPHDCRHTFSYLCEKYGVNENDRKRMMGHAFQNDITNSVYGHRTVTELREQIEKIKLPE